MAIFSFLVKMGLDATQFNTGVKQSQSVLHKFSHETLGGVKARIAEAFTIAAVVEMAHRSIEAGKEISNLSEKLGLTTDEVQKLQVASNEAGVDINQMGQMFLKVGEFRKKAVLGNEENQALAMKYGLTISDLNNPMLKNKDIAEKISEAFQESNKGAAEQSDLVAMAGTRAERLLAVLANINELGPIKLISKEDIEELKKASVALEELKRQSTIAMAPIISFWGRVLERGNKLQKDNPNFINMDLWRAYKAEREDDGSGTPTKPITPKELSAAKAALNLANKGLWQRPMIPGPLINEGLGDIKPQTSSSLNKIGGFMWDAGSQEDAFKEIKRATQKTADNTGRLVEQISKEVDL